jgi:hypothetical protein
VWIFRDHGAFRNYRVLTPSFAPEKHQNQLPVFDAAIWCHFVTPEWRIQIRPSRRRNRVVGENEKTAMQRPKSGVRIRELPQIKLPGVVGTKRVRPCLHESL